MMMWVINRNNSCLIQADKQLIVLEEVDQSSGIVRASVHRNSILPGHHQHDRSFDWRLNEILHPEKRGRG